MFWIAWTKRPRKVKAGDGYINCPVCRDRQPAQLSVIRLQTFLYGFIPLGSGEDTNAPEFYWCKKCHREFTNDGRHGYDFGPNYQGSPDWKCFKCGSLIPHSQIQCSSCGWNFLTGQFH